MQPTFPDNSSILHPTIKFYLDSLNLHNQKSVLSQHQEAWIKLFFLAHPDPEDIIQYSRVEFVNLINENGDNFIFYIIKKYKEEPFVFNSNSYSIISNIISNVSSVSNGDNANTIFHLIAAETYWDKEQIEFETNTLFPLGIPLDEIKERQIVLNPQNETPLAILYSTFSQLMKTTALTKSQVAAYVHLFCYFLKLDLDRAYFKLEAISAMLELIERTSDYQQSCIHLIDLFRIESDALKQRELSTSLFQKHWWTLYSNSTTSEWDLILCQQSLRVKKSCLNINAKNNRYENKKDFLEFFIEQHSNSIHLLFYNENQKNPELLKKRKLIITNLYEQCPPSAKMVKQSWTYLILLARLPFSFLQVLLFQIRSFSPAMHEMDDKEKTCLNYLLENFMTTLKKNYLFALVILTSSFCDDFKRFLTFLFDNKVTCSINILKDLDSALKSFNDLCSASKKANSSHFGKLIINQQQQQHVDRINALINFIAKNLQEIYAKEPLNDVALFFSQPSHLATSFAVSNSIEKPVQQTISPLLEVSEKRATSLYNELVGALLIIWTNNEIQSNIRRLMGLSNGDRVINLSLAICEDMTLDWRGISYILKPFVDFLKAMAKTNDCSLAEAIVADAISSTGLMIELADEEKLSEILQKLTHEESQTNFILSLLIKNRKAQDELKAYKAAEEIFPIEFHPQQPEISIGTRDLLLYYTLQEVAIRATVIQTLLKKRLKPNASSYRSQTAFLVYTIKDQSFVCPLMAISGERQSIVSIGNDDKNKTSYRLLNDLISGSLPDGLSAYPIQASDLTALQAAYKASKPSPFYLFTPLESLYLKTRHEALPDLQTPFLEKTKRTRAKKPLKERSETDQPSELGDRSSILSKPQRTTYPINDELPAGCPQTSSKSLNEYSFPANHLLSDSFPKLNGKRNAISSEEEKDDDKNVFYAKKRKTQKAKPNPYQSIQPSIQPLPSPQQPSKNSRPKEFAVALNPASRLLKNKPVASSSIESDDSIESLINARLGQFALDRIERIVAFGNLSDTETLLKITKALIEKLTLVCQKRPIVFEDSQLKNYQKEGVSAYLELASKGLGFILAFAPGLGKTKTACEAMRQLVKLRQLAIQSASGWPSLVIVPHSLVMQWEESLLSQQFSSRQRYYLELIPSFSKFSTEQKKSVADLHVQFFISHHKHKATLLESKEKKTVALAKHKEKKVDLKQQEANKIHKTTLKRLSQKIETLELEIASTDRFIKDSYVVLEQAVTQNGELASLLLPTLAAEANKLDAPGKFMEGLISAYCSSHVKDSSKLAQAKQKLIHKNFMGVQGLINRQPDQIKLIVSEALNSVNDFPATQNQGCLFLSTLANVVAQQGPVAPFSFDPSLLQPNIYRQVVVYTSQKRKSIEQTIDQVVVTTHSALSSLKPKQLEEFKRIPWLGVVIDEAHEWGWNLSQGSAIEEKKEALFIKTFINALYDKHKTHLLLLTGTPQVNNCNETLSLLQLANPGEDFKSLAIELENRKAVFERRLMVAFNHLAKAQAIEASDLSKLDDALSGFILAFQHVNQLFNRLILTAGLQDETVQQDWTTPDGQILLPKSEPVLIERSLTQEQTFVLEKSCTNTNNLFKLDNALISLIFHPWLASEKWAKSSDANIKQEMRSWNDEQWDFFIEQSSFLSYVFKDESFRQKIQNGESILFFLPQIRFSKILKLALAHYFPVGQGSPFKKAKLYNGKKDSSVRAALVKEFESEDSSIQFFLLTPDSASVGLNLGAAKCVVNLSPWWNEAMTEQMEARALRAGKNTLTSLISFNFETVRELHKNHTVKIKAKWKEAYLSKLPFDQTIALFRQAAIQEVLTINLNSTARIDEVREEIAFKKEKLLQLFDLSYANIQERLKDRLGKIDLSSFEGLAMQEDASNLLEAAPEQMEIEPKISSDTLNLPLEATDLIKEQGLSSIDDNPLAAALQSQEASLVVMEEANAPNAPRPPKKLNKDGLNFQVVPLPALNPNAAISAASRIMNPLNAQAIGCLLSSLNKLNEREWDMFIENPTKFLAQNATRYGLQLLISTSDVPLNNFIRWLTYEEGTGLALKQPNLKNQSSALRLLEIAPQRYALLIKLA